MSRHGSDRQRAAWTRRVRPFTRATVTPERPRDESGAFTMLTPKPAPPRDSWWTRTASREEFDQKAAQRSREAGWKGVGSTERK